MNASAAILIGVSLALTGGMALVLLRVLRDERRRGDARVAALSRMAAAEAHADWASDAVFLPEPPPEPERLPLKPQSIEELEAGRTDSLRPSPRAIRIGIAGAIAALLILVTATALVRSSPGPHGGSAAETVSGAAPLELMALTHTQAPGVLNVSGRVRNPPGGRTAGNLTATIFLFGPDGSFLNSGRVALGGTALDAGAVSSFTATIPVAGPVARYRVSFRDSRGQPVPHVDKRNGAPVARNERPPE